MMTSQEPEKKLENEIQELLDFLEKDLVSRNEWGSINFIEAKPKYDEVKEILNFIKELPLELHQDQERYILE